MVFIIMTGIMKTDLGRGRAPDTTSRFSHTILSPNHITLPEFLDAAKRRLGETAAAICPLVLGIRSSKRYKNGFPVTQVPAIVRWVTGNYSSTGITASDVRARVRTTLARQGCTTCDIECPVKTAVNYGKK